MSIRIKNWPKYQHFRDRMPPWIKLYREILDDPDWHDLDGREAKVLVGLWLVASEDATRTGTLPELRKVAFRLRVSEDALQQSLTKLSHWLDTDDITLISPRHQDDAPETEGETETETETETDPTDAGASDERPTEQPAEPAGFADAWAAYPKRGGGNPRKAAMRAYGARINAGRTPAELLAGTERYARYIRARNREHTEFVMQAKTFFGPDDWWAEQWGLPASVPGSADWEADQLAAQLEAERDSTLAPLPPGPLQ